MRDAVWKGLVRKERRDIPLTLAPGESDSTSDARGFGHPRPQAYDVLIFWTQEDDRASVLDGVADRFAADGHRVFLVATFAGAPAAPRVEPVRDGVFQVTLPPLAGPSDHSSPAGAGTAATAPDDAWIDFRHEHNVEDAICFVDQAAYLATALALRERMDWKLISGLRRTASERDAAQASDLVLADPADSAELGDIPRRLFVVGPGGLGAHWTALKAALLDLFPLVSVVVVTYNKLDFNRLCLQSIYDKTTYPNVEVVVVDNGSSDGTREYLKEVQALHANCKLVFNDSNDGYGPANNRGVAVASGLYLVLLNNDTVVTRPWLSRLIRPLRDPRIGLVGPVSSWPGNESGIETSYPTLFAMEAFAREYTAAREGKWYDAGRVIFFCVAMRRAVWDEVGPIDEQYALGVSFEDDDYNERVKQKGYRNIYVEDAFVHHWGVATNSSRDVRDHWQLIEKNRRYFESKWGTWNPHRGMRSRRR
jgi:GT2 family glycosyltransferase